MTMRKGKDTIVEERSRTCSVHMRDHGEEDDDVLVTMETIESWSWCE